MVPEGFEADGTGLTRVVRFVGTIVLATCLYFGQRWARYVTAGLSGASAIAGIFSLPFVFRNHNDLLLPWLGMTIGCAVVALILAFSTRANQFMDRYRENT